MTSMFDSLVYQRRRHTPWARMDFESFVKEMTLEGRKVKLDCVYDHRMASRFWWTLTWYDQDDEDKEEQLRLPHSVGAQYLDLCLWRAAEAVLQQREREARRVQREQAKESSQQSLVLPAKKEASRLDESENPG